MRDGDVLLLDDIPGGAPQSQGPGRLYIDTPIPGATSYSIRGVAAGLIAGPTPAYDLSWTDPIVDAQGRAMVAVHPMDSSTGLPDGSTFHVFNDVRLADTVQSPLHVTSWTSQTWTLDLRLQSAQPLEVVGTTFSNWHQLQRYIARFGPSRPAATVHDYSIELPSYGSGITLDLMFRESPAGSARRHWYVMPLPNGQVVIDLSAPQLPRILSMNITPSSLRPTISWALQTGASTMPDLTALIIRGPISWRFALPPGLTSYRVPELPPDVAVDLSNIETGVMLFDRNDFAGYAAARGRFVESFINGPLLTMGFVFRQTNVGDVLF